LTAKCRYSGRDEKVNCLEKARKKRTEKRVINGVRTRGFVEEEEPPTRFSWEDTDKKGKNVRGNGSLSPDEEAVDIASRKVIQRVAA